MVRVCRGGSRIRETGVRQARARVRPALVEHTLGGAGRHPPPDFRPSEIVAGAIWGRNTRPPHLLRHARNRSSAWRSQRGVLNYASYFRSGNFDVLYTPINNYTNGVAPVAGPTASARYPSQRRLSSPYAYSQVSAPPSRIIGTVGSKGGSSAPNEPPLDPPLVCNVCIHMYI